MYSTIVELRGNGFNFSLTHSPDLTDLIVTARITEADKIVKTDLSKIVDFDLIVTTPNFINELSQYKTCEKCLIWLYSRKRQGEENDDIQYWINEYDKLLQKVIDGEIELVDDDGTSIAGGSPDFSNDAKSGIRPALGLGDYGEFKNKSDLEDERPIV